MSRLAKRFEEVQILSFLFPILPVLQTVLSSLPAAPAYILRVGLQKATKRARRGRVILRVSVPHLMIPLQGHNPVIRSPVQV